MRIEVKKNIETSSDRETQEYLAEIFWKHVRGFFICNQKALTDEAKRAS